MLSPDWLQPQPSCCESGRYRESWQHCNHTYFSTAKARYMVHRPGKYRTLMSFPASVSSTLWNVLWDFWAPSPFSCISLHQHGGLFLFCLVRASRQCSKQSWSFDSFQPPLLWDTLWSTSSHSFRRSRSPITWFADLES